MDTAPTSAPGMKDIHGPCNMAVLLAHLATQERAALMIQWLANTWTRDQWDHPCHIQDQDVKVDQVVQVLMVLAVAAGKMVLGHSPTTNAVCKLHLSSSASLEFDTTQLVTVTSPLKENHGKKLAACWKKPQPWPATCNNKLECDHFTLLPTSSAILVT